MSRDRLHLRGLVNGRFIDVWFDGVSCILRVQVAECLENRETPELGLSRLEVTNMSGKMAIVYRFDVFKRVKMIGPPHDVPVSLEVLHVL